MSQLNIVILRLTIILSVPLVIGLLAYTSLHYFFEVPVKSKSSESVLIMATPSKNIKELCREIADAGVIRNWRSLYLLTRLRGQKLRIKAGEYRLQATMTPKQILTVLSGDPFKRKMVLPAGLSLRDLGAEFEKAGLATKAEVDKVLSDTNLIAKAGIRGGSFEGYLLPSTYEFSKGQPLTVMVWNMMERGEKLWVSQGYSRLAEALGLTRDEILIIASIIEAESHKTDLQPIISSVLHNRLKNGMKLQSLATVRYGLDEPDKQLVQEDLKSSHAYNTFVSYGLPPGPICNPSKEAIEAALSPMDSTFLFYTSDNAGGVVFSRTESEYAQSLRQYGNPVK